MWYKNADTTFFHFVTNPAFDRRTDKQTDRIFIARQRLHCMQRANNYWKKTSPLNFEWKQYPAICGKVLSCGKMCSQNAEISHLWIHPKHIMEHYPVQLLELSHRLFQLRLCFVPMHKCPTPIRCTLMTRQPHSGEFQVTAARNSEPYEVNLPIHATPSAFSVPETTAMVSCALAVAIIIIDIICCELATVAVGHGVFSGISRIPSNVESVSVRLAVHDKSAVFSPKPLLRCWLLQVESQLVAVVFGQFVKKVVSDPDVTTAIVESHFEFVPRAVEEVWGLDVLLDEKWKAIR